MFHLKHIIMDSKQYWDEKIIEWEDSMKGRQEVSFIEKLAARFRKSLSYRSALAEDMVKPFVGGKKVLDLGCGSGFFAFQLYEQAHPEHITGIDISSRAIARAEEIAAERGLTSAFTFQEGDVAGMALPEVEVTVGLGFFDYLTLPEITQLFNNLRTKHFLFSFSERKFSIMRFMHIVYMLSQNCPKHFYNTKEEIGNCVGNQYTNVQFLNDPQLSFACIVHNLPQKN